jgi:lysozyme family protein
MTSLFQDQAFCIAIPLLLELEGGYVNDPADPGGATNFGISQRSYPSVNIANLTADEAAQLYYTDYWLAGQCPAIPFPLCAYHFDACVNQGVSEANKILQKTVGVPVDGVVGPVTLAAVASLPRAQHYSYLINRMEVYRGLSGWATFGNGWTNRLIHLAASLG